MLDSLRRQYLSLLKLSLADFTHANTLSVAEDGSGAKITFRTADHQRITGDDWPMFAETMIGLKRLDNFQWCIESALAEKIPGDIIECGVWRGGASILAAGVLYAHNATERKLWVCDSFQGLPPPTDPADKNHQYHKIAYLAATVPDVQWSFSRYNLLLPETQLQFVPGWFADTLPGLREKKWAVLRADGDMYSSTRDILHNLYDGVSPGGYVIIDDYFWTESARQATDDFRRERGITEPVQQIDHQGGWWRKG